MQEFTNLHSVNCKSFANLAAVHRLHCFDNGGGCNTDRNMRYFAAAS